MLEGKAKTIAIARRHLSDQPFFLDTETTGLGDNAEIVDIAIVDFSGNIIFNSMVKPSKSIPSEATKIHGITDEMVRDSPTWNDIWPKIQRALSGQVLGIYNEEFDVRMMKQSCQLNNCSWSPPYRNSFCIMELYAQYYGAWSEYHKNFTWQSLEKARNQCKINLPNSHRALADTFLSRAVMFHMAGEDWMVLQSTEIKKPQQHHQDNSTIIRKREIIPTKPSQGKIITFMSPRSDTGKTTILANVASQLSVMGYRVGIADLNFEYPQLHLFFGIFEDTIHFSLKDYLKGDCSIKDVAFHVGWYLSRLRGRESIKGKVLWLFPSITTIRSESINRIGENNLILSYQGFQTVIGDMELDFLLLDADLGIIEETVSLLSVTDILISVFRPESLDYQGALQCLDFARMLDVPNLFLVVNKVLPRYDFTQVKEEIRSTFDCRVASVLPFCDDVVEITSSDFLVLRNPEHPWSKAIIEIVQNILDTE